MIPTHFYIPDILVILILVIAVLSVIMAVVAVISSRTKQKIKRGFNERYKFFKGEMPIVESSILNTTKNNVGSRVFDNYTKTIVDYLSTNEELKEFNYRDIKSMLNEFFKEMLFAQYSKQKSKDLRINSNELMKGAEEDYFESKS